MSSGCLALIYLRLQLPGRVHSCAATQRGGQGFFKNAFASTTPPFRGVHCHGTRCSATRTQTRTRKLQAVHSFFFCRPGSLVRQSVLFPDDRAFCGRYLRTRVPWARGCGVYRPWLFAPRDGAMLQNAHSGLDFSLSMYIPLGHGA